MFGLSYSDIVAIAAYFSVVIFIGVWSARRIKNREDFFLAGRRFGKVIQTAAAFGQATSSDAPVTATVWVARNGIAGLWAAMSNILALPFFWITCVWYRRMRLLTMADFFEERYQSKGISIFYSVFSSLFFVIMLALGFSAMTKTINGMMVKPAVKLTAEEKSEYQMAVEREELERMDYNILSQPQKDRLDGIRLVNPRKEFSYINPAVLTWTVAIKVIIYGAMGGLEAAFLTDMLQGILIIILSVLLIPFLYSKIGSEFNVNGISGILEVARSNLPQEAFELLNSPTATDTKWYFVFVISVVMVLNVATQANQLTANGAAKDEYAARYGFTMGIYIKRVCVMLWGITALLVVILYGNSVHNPDYLWGYACNDLLGMAGFGLVGLMIACLMAALMSTVSTLMLSGSALFTINVIKPLWPNMNEKQCVNIGRIAGILIVVSAAYISLMYQQLFDLMKLVITFNCMLAPLFWLGVKWRRANRTAAWSCLAASIVLFYVAPAIVSSFDKVRTSNYLAKTTEPVTVTRTYMAKTMDVEKRNKEIQQWQQLSDAQKQNVAHPLELSIGQKFTASYVTPKKSVFWGQGLHVSSDGRLYGKGMLNLELVLIDAMGFDLSKNSYALNETIRFLAMMFLPFVVFYAVSKLTRPLDKTVLDKFYVRMKTPVFGTHQDDIKEMELSYQNPSRFDHKKMFPNTDWEFEKFDKTDIKGIVIATAGGMLLIAVLFIIASLGKA